MSALLAISIGPVQGFIAAARKARDLWFGSNLLGQVSLAAATALDGAGATLIFPSPDAIATREPVANKLLAIVPATADRPTPDRWDALAHEAANTVLRELGKDVHNRLHDHRSIDWQLFDDQLAGLLEWYSAWMPFADGDNYKRRRGEVELLLAGRKALRDFSSAPKPSHPGRPQSSLDPSLASVIADDRHPWSEARIKQGEHLDGVSLVKRVAQPRRFVSVSRVAVDPFIRRAAGRPELAELNRLATRLQDSEAVERIVDQTNALQHFATFPFDTQLFFDPADRDKLLREPHEDARAEAELHEHARAFFAKVQDLAKDPAIGQPSPYFAVLAADGDRVGKALGRLDQPHLHRDFSTALAKFASRAAEIVRAHHGGLLYTGGDDVLAFLPLDTALCCADSLRLAFVDLVRDAAGGEDVSLSVGVSIAHYGEHLDSLLQWARDAEHAAKEFNNKARNALAVALHTRTSGEDAITVAHSWDEDPVNDVWWPWVRRHRDDEVPDGAAYELRNLIDELRPFAADASTGSSPAAVLATEARRILARKEPGRHGQPPPPDQPGRGVGKALIADIVAVATPPASNQPASPANGQPQSTAGLDGLERLVRVMLIARRLAVVMDAPCTPGESTAEVGNGR